ncbi:MAG: IS200/IS605 family transposase [Candidatus Margulisbacteria bacterium]|nr:IS200/IS605 family transposase [Candidatus Margulisiibacteriota bacterium]
MYKTFHYTFSTYKRKKILNGNIVKELAIIFIDICREKELRLICQNILVEHVHLLVEKKASDSNEYVMKMIKGISSRQFFKKNPSNRLEFRKLWGRGYRAEEIMGEQHLRHIIAYIEGQKVNGIDKRIKPIWKPRRTSTSLGAALSLPKGLVAGFQKRRIGSRDV